MSDLRIPPTQKTPEVQFDRSTGTLLIKGCSIHENSDAFFTPIFEQVEAYATSPQRNTLVELYLDYFNSSSAKYILDLLKCLDDLHQSGRSKVRMDWFHDPKDLDMQEAGHDYKGLLEMPVRIIAKRR